MDISRHIFGTTSDGQQVEKFVVTNSSGASISLISYGAAIQAICVPDRDGALRDVLLGYDSVEEYESNGNYFFGATIGRVANRIENACFRLGSKNYPLVINHGTRSCLHGGNKGFDKQVWQGEVVGDSVVFSRLSPDGEEGFPGNLLIKAVYTFTEKNEIVIDYEAETDSDTIINITNHSYFNLDGHDAGDIGGHSLAIAADQFAESNDECLATGSFLELADTKFDFRSPVLLKDAFDPEDSQQKLVGGYDHSFLIRGYNGMVRLAAEVFSAASGIRMRVYTNKPSIHFYSGNFMEEMPAKGGGKYDYRGGFCLETQYLPNAMKNTHFPSIVLHAGDTYLFRTVYSFSL